MLHLCIIVLCLPSIKDLLPFFCFRRWSLSVNNYVCIKHCNVDTPQNKLLFLLTIFCLYFFSFNRIATKKTSRWLAAHPGQRYSLLFIFTENDWCVLNLHTSIHFVSKTQEGRWCNLQFLLFLVPLCSPTPGNDCYEGLCWEHLLFFERLMGCQDSYYNPGTCIVILENYFLSFTFCNVDVHNIMYTSRDQH